MLGFAKTEPPDPAAALAAENRGLRDQLAEQFERVTKMLGSHAAESRRFRERLAVLTERLVDLQTANEGAYRELYKATGGPRFDPAQPFGSPPETPVSLTKDES